MRYDDFIRLVKCHESLQLQAKVDHNRCTTNRIPVELGQLLPFILAILKANIASFCDPATEIIQIFNMQPVGLLPENKHQRDDFWCDLEFDVVSQKAQPGEERKILRTRALQVNLSTGEVVNNAYYMRLLGAADADTPEGKCLGHIPKDYLHLAWSRLLKNYYLNRHCGFYLDEFSKLTIDNYANPVFSINAIYPKQSMVKSNYYARFFKSTIDSSKYSMLSAFSPIRQAVNKRRYEDSESYELNLERNSKHRVIMKSV